MVNKSEKRPTAIVTGASQGIGKAIAHRLADDGADVILVGRSLDKLRLVREEIVAKGNSAFAMSLDLADVEGIVRFAGDFAAKFEKLDILVLCAAVYHTGTWLTSTIDSLDEQYRINIRGNYALIQKMLASLIDANGDIVFVNSSITMSNGGHAGQYAATKHALKGLATSLRAEVNQHGVRVLSVFPGRTATPMQEEIFRNEGREYLPDLLLQPSDIANVVSACLDLPDTAEVTDLHIRPKHLV